MWVEHMMGEYLFILFLNTFCLHLHAVVFLYAAGVLIIAAVRPIDCAARGIFIVK